MSAIRTFFLSLAMLALAAPTFAQTPCPHPAPRLESPANGVEGVTQSVLFRWSAVQGAHGYKLFAAFNGETTFEQIGDTSANDFSIDLPPNTLVEWYVEARFDDCNSRSDHFFFTTISCVVPAVTLFSPADGASTTSPVRFTWSEVPDALGYRLWAIDEDLEFYVLDETPNTESTVRIPPGVYGWFVETLFECGSEISEVFIFTVPRAQNCTTEKPVPLSPIGVPISTTPVTFIWRGVQGAVGYQLWAALDDGDYELIDETTGTTSQAWLSEGTISWVVVAQFNGCDDIVSDPVSFTVPFNPQCDNGSAYPIIPAEGERDVPTRVEFVWTPVADAIRYNVYIAADDGEPRKIGSTGSGDDHHGATETRLVAQVPEGVIWWAVETEFNGCPSELSPATFFETNASAVCRTPGAPDIYVEPQARSGEQYLLIWSPGSNTISYEVQESTSPTFSTPTTRTVTDILLLLSHAVSTPTRFYYRIRSLSSCGLGFGPYSDVASTVVTPDEVVDIDEADVVTNFGEQETLVQRVHLPGVTPPQQFSVSTDQPWLRVEPAGGTIGPNGIDVNVSANPDDLPVGTNTGTLIVTLSGAGKDAAATAPASIPFSINLATPVSPNAGSAPLPNSLIIPAVAHAAGFAISFESDVRVANTSAQVIKYLLNFTPTQSDGTKAGQQTTIQIQPGETAALNDVLKNFYGFAADGDSVSGVLEIRPLSSNSSNSTPQNVTFASSRTYAVTPNGTYGQFIPAIPFSSFVGRGPQGAAAKALSLQQIAQSAAYRTNLGLVEAAGEAASVNIAVFGDDGRKLGDYPVELKPGEHRQLNGFLAQHGLTMNDGRFQITVTSATGRVSAYASVLDNRTNDPMLVMPVDPTTIAARRFILPGIADINTPVARWRSDVRLFNAGSSKVPVTLTFYALGDPNTTRTATREIEAGQVLAIDNAVETLFGMQNIGGQVVASTPTDANVVATARTYNESSAGTYGQFIPGLTVGEGIGVGSRALQVLQIEESDRFRTNLGIFELSGNPALVEITASTPDAKSVARTSVELRPNEFKQISSILRNMGLQTTYNARITLRVVSGTGRISGYASLIDNRTQDPTYVPAQ